jgi:ABC-2 type transport system permease protein
MAWLTFTPESRGQFAAIAQLRWRMFLNSLRTRRGKVELFSRIMMGIVFFIGAVGGAVGLAAGSWYFVSQNKTEWLAVLLWPVFLFWQFFPVAATALTQNAESSELLRFPLTYRSYFLLRVAYGLFDPATAVGSVWLVGIFLGITVGNPLLAPWAALVLLGFALVNVLLTRTIFAWLERWLAQRKTREIFGVLLFLFFISFQFIGPLTGRYFSHKPKPQTLQKAQELAAVQKFLPPGVSAEAMAGLAGGHGWIGMAWFGALAGYGLAFAWLLNFRLLAQYQGESLSEADIGRRAKQEHQPLRLGWNVPGVSGPVAAIFEKDLRVISRSGPILLMLIMPIVTLLIFRAGRVGSGANWGNSMSRVPDIAFPLGIAYSLLMLTNLVYNGFGPEGSGIQFFFVSPVRFRQIVLAKNLAHTVFLMAEVVLVWLGVTFMYGRPSLPMTLVALAGLLFAAPVNFIGGNLLSIYSPKKVDYGTFGRQRASQLTVLASFGIQIVIFGVGAATVLLSRLYGNIWIAVPVFLGLAVVAFAGYFLVLKQVDNIAPERRETLIAELAKA